MTLKQAINQTPAQARRAITRAQREDRAAEHVRGQVDRWIAEARELGLLPAEGPEQVDGGQRRGNGRGGGHAGG